MTTLLEDILSVCSQIMDYLLNLSERQILMLALAISIFVLPMELICAAILILYLISYFHFRGDLKC